MKKILSVLLCVALLLALAACDPATPTEPQGTTPSTNAPTEPAGFNVAGSYKFDPGDQNGGGLLQFVLNRGHLVIELGQGQNGLTLGEIQIEGDLICRGQRMDHIRDTAHQIHRIEHGDSLRAVGHGDGHLVALADADGLQSLGAVFNFLYHFAVGGGFAHEVKGYLLRVLLRYLLHHLKHGAFKVI